MKKMKFIIITKKQIMLAIAELVPYEFTTSKDSMDTVYITLSKH